MHRPTTVSIDGLRLDRFEPGREYEVGSSVGALLLAEGWAVPVPLEENAAVPEPPAKPAAPKPLKSPQDPPNLLKEIYPPYLDRLPPEAAAAFERRRTLRMEPSGRPPKPPVPES